LRLEGPLAHSGAASVGWPGAVVLLAFIGQWSDPDVFGPVASLLDNLILAFLLFSPLGFVYLAIIGIAHRARRKQHAI